MNSFFQESLFAGVTISLLAYLAGSFLKKKFKLGILNPLLISIVITILVLVVADVDYDTYDAGAKYLSWFLTPATVCLAIPLYEQWQLLKRHWRAVLLGILQVFLPAWEPYLSCLFCWGCPIRNMLHSCQSRSRQRSVWDYRRSWAAM